MSDQPDFYRLPENLPILEDDGVADHLLGARLPSVPLASTSGNLVDLSALEGRTVVYFYPRDGGDGNGFAYAGYGAACRAYPLQQQVRK